MTYLTFLGQTQKAITIKQPLHGPSNFHLGFVKKSIQDSNRFTSLFNGLVPEIVGNLPHLFKMSARGHRVSVCGQTSASETESNGKVRP